MRILSDIDIESERKTVELKKTSQKKQIIKNLFLFDSMTIVDLCQNLKLSTPKMISLLNELKSERLIEELGQGNSSGGRRPVLFGNKEDAFYIIGISIDIYQTSVSVFNAKNKTVSGTQVLQIPISQNNAIVDQIVAFVEELILELQISRNKIIGIGIEMPGLVDSKRGLNKTYMVSEEPIAAVFRKKFEMEVLIENDAKTKAFAELRFGLAHSKRNVLAIHLDWGIGLGIIVDGKLYKGRDGFAGEFGHLPMVENDTLCKCGKRGCLETIASGTAIARMALDGIKAGRSTFLSEFIRDNQEIIEVQQVMEAASLGDQYSISILTNVGHWLGKGIASLIQIFNPERIILGGKVSEAGHFILPPIQQSINNYCNPELGKNIDIKVSTLGREAGIKGIATMLAEQVFNKKQSSQ